MIELTPTQKAFRNSMASLTAAVNVITTNGVAGRCGITATAVCSITDSPPTILVCINRKSEMNAVFKENAVLCVNVLEAEQLEVAQHFAGMTGVAMEDRFGLHHWSEGVAGLPVLMGALCNLQGRITSMSEVGTHTLFMVELDDILVREQGNALVYFNRAFHAISTTPQQAVCQS